LLCQAAGRPHVSTIDRLENVVANYTDPTSRPVDPGVEQPDPRFDEAGSDPGRGERGPSGSFAESELEYPKTERAADAYDRPGSFESESGSTVETAKSEAANVKDTAAGAASGVKEVARGEVAHVADEAKYQTRNLVDQTRYELQGQVRYQQSSLASKLNGWASELGSMAAKSDESGPMTDLAQQASRRVGEFSYWLDNHEPADLLDEVKRFARRRPGAFIALAAAAGVVVGRLTRGAVARNTSVDSDTDVTPARAYDSDIYDRGGYGGDVPGSSYGAARAYESGFDPRYGEVAGETSYQGGGMPAPGQEPPATSPAYPNVTPTTDEPYYPPPTEGEVRR
jgi:hypothetical protein